MMSSKICVVVTNTEQEKQLSVDGKDNVYAMIEEAFGLRVLKVLLGDTEVFVDDSFEAHGIEVNVASLSLTGSLSSVPAFSDRSTSDL